MTITGKKTLDHSDVTYGIIRINDGDIAKNLPTLYRPIIIVDEKGVEYEKRMHLSVANRINGLTKLYRSNDVKIGDTVEMELDGIKLKMSFKHTSENNTSEAATAIGTSFKEQDEKAKNIGSASFHKRQNRQIGVSVLRQRNECSGGNC